MSDEKEEAFWALQDIRFTKPHDVEALIECGGRRLGRVFMKFGFEPSGEVGYMTKFQWDPFMEEETDGDELRDLWEKTCTLHLHRFVNVYLDLTSESKKPKLH